MNWTAVVPMKAFDEAKTRLSCDLSVDARVALAREMFHHVTAVLNAHPWVSRLVVVSQSKIPGFAGEWFKEAGRGLNPALEAARDAFGMPLAIFHADLPLLTVEDVSALLDAGARSGVAIAPDRHDRGTNAIAVYHALHFPFRFGKDSCSRHLIQCRSAPSVVRTTGLGHDCDTMEDLGSFLRATAAS